MLKNQTYEKLDSRIQELEQAEARWEIKKKALQEDLDRYRTIVNHLPILVCNFLPGGEILFVNDAYCSYFDSAFDELVGSTFLSMIPETDREKVMDNISALTPDAPTQSHEHAVITPTGNIRWQRWINRAIFDGRGKVVEYQSIGEDITDRKQAEAGLRQQKDYLNSLLETIPNPVFYKDNHGKYTGCNRAFEDFIGKPRSNIVGKTVYELGPKEIADKYYQMDSALFKKPGKQHYEWKIKKSGGELRDVIFDKATIKDSSGHVVGLVGVISDITERKKSEQALQKSESTLKAILAASPIGICLVRKRILKWTNQSMYRIWGYEMDSLLGQNTRVLYSDTKEYERVGREFYNAVERHGVGNIETQWVTGNGEKIHCYLQGCQLDASDSTKGIIVAAMDITERIHAEDMVRNLSHMLIEAQENERKMISYELHDSIAQNLSYLKISCDTFFDNHAGISPQLTAKMGKQSKLIALTIDAVRELSYGLHPPSLDQLGITQTIFQLCEEFSDAAGIGVDFIPTGMEALKHDPSLEINIYRLIQEGLNNIRKHADASHVKIVLIASYPNILLRIQDDGKGFDVKAREAELDGTKRMGLRSMTERVNLLQGIIKIKSRPAQGTKIFIKIPFMKGKRNGGSEKTPHHYRRSSAFS
jgi:PAS domain S-box-containing protein